MRNLISTLSSAIITTGLGGVTYIVIYEESFTTIESSNQVSTSVTKVNSSSKVFTPAVSKDNYVIHWTGKKGKNFTGIASIASDDSLARTYAVTKTLPHTYKFSATKNTVVSAMGTEPGVKVTILKNGVKCGESTVEGNAIGDMRTCF